MFGSVYFAKIITYLWQRKLLKEKKTIISPKQIDIYEHLRGELVIETKES